MFKKIIIWSVMITIVVIILTNLKNMHYYYHDRHSEYTDAVVYLKTDVCQNGELSKQLASSRFSKCNEARKVKDMSPFTLAFYDFLEDMYVCGHGRCDKVWNEIATKLPYITFFMGTVLVYVAWNTIHDQRLMNAQMYWQLPAYQQMMPARMGMNRGQEFHID